MLALGPAGLIVSIELPLLLGNAKSLLRQRPGDPGAELCSKHFTTLASGVCLMARLEKQFYIFIGKLLPIDREMMP